MLERLGRFSAADLMLREVPIVLAGARIRDFLPELLARRDCEAAFVAEYAQLPEEGVSSKMLPWAAP